MTIFKTIFKTLNKNASSFTITDESISNNSIFEVYPSDDSVILADVTVNGTTANITFDSAAEYNIPCAVFINNLVGAYEPITHVDASDVNYTNIHLPEVDNVNDTLDYAMQRIYDIGNNVGDINSELHGSAVVGGVLYHVRGGNEWKRLTGIDVDYDENTTINEKLDEVFQSVSNGKGVIASAITDKGVPTLATDTFAIMADHIAEIEGGGESSAKEYNITYIDNIYLNQDNGEEIADNSSHATTFIDISAFNKLLIYNVNSWLYKFYNVFYDENKQYISNFNVNNWTSVTVPSNAKYARLSTEKTSNFTLIAYEYNGGIIPSGTDVSDTTALESDVLLGKIFHKADGSRAVGTLEAAKVKNGAITLTTSDQTINCGFKPTQVCVCVGANRTTYFGFGINTNGTTVGSRVAGTGATSATTPATITITDDGFKVKAIANSYALAATYFAIG